MSSVRESLIFHHSKDVVISAIKSISKDYKDITLTDVDCYDLRCTSKSFMDALRAYPVTISIRVVSIDSKKCNVEIDAHNFGAFYLNQTQCMMRLSEFKSLLSNELASYTQSSSISIADEILKYKKLLDLGAISEEEYNRKKKELLNKN